MVVLLKPDPASEPPGPFSNTEARAPPQTHRSRISGNGTHISRRFINIPCQKMQTSIEGAERPELPLIAAVNVEWCGLFGREFGSFLHS